MMGSSPVANPVCWGSIIAIPLNLTIPFDAILFHRGPHEPFVGIKSDVIVVLEIPHQRYPGMKAAAPDLQHTGGRHHTPDA